MSDAGLEELPDATLVLDAARRVVRANSAACRLLALAPGDLLGAPLTDTVDARTAGGRPLWGSGWGAAERLRGVTGAPDQPVTVRRGDGTTVTLAATARYCRADDGSVAGAVVGLRDAGRRLRAQAASAGEIVSTVSHELRSPLTSVKGFTSLMLNRWDRLTDDQKRMMLGQVNHDADRVTRLITELLDISRLESGRLVLRRQMVALPALARSVVEKVRLEYQSLEVTETWADAMPAAWADPDKVEQVLTNLLENACKYASPLGLAVEGGTGGEQVWVSVADRGEGIAAADLPHVFTKFFRRSEGRPTGSGLGLWISRGLVEAHGGSLVATAIPGEGSTFRFTLPVADLEGVPAP